MVLAVRETRLAGFFPTTQPTNPVGYNLTTKVQTLIQSLINVGTLVSCLFMFKFGARMSPRTGLWTASVFGVVSIAAQIGSQNLAALYVGRVVLGISNGFPLGVMFVVPVLISAARFFLAETPRYYVARDQEDRAVAAIRKLRGVKDEEQLRKNAWLEEQEAGPARPSSPACSGLLCHFPLPAALCRRCAMPLDSQWAPPAVGLTGHNTGTALCVCRFQWVDDL